MNAVTTGLAKAKYDPEDHQVNVFFNGWATPESYQETLDIVLEVGLINRTNHWVFNFDQLKGLKPEYMVHVLVEWMKGAYEKMLTYRVNNKGQIAIISSKDLRKFSVAVKKAKDKHLIPEWITLKVFENESKLFKPEKVKTKTMEISSIEESL